MPRTLPTKESAERIAKAFIRSFMPGVIKPLHVLWNEILGFVFFVLALLVTLGPVRRGYHELDGDPANSVKFALAVLLAVVMLGFGVYSFQRARHIGRS
jgi:sterol desaturase/sphingolipid hydroxylase (fatty acid hydroxylase superfamily)